MLIYNTRNPEEKTETPIIKREITITLEATIGEISTLEQYIENHIPEGEDSIFDGIIDEMLEQIL